ncbi:hypothetical protein CHH28_02100 [Bacterioplanes sanyensis]|uniref:Peptidase S8/S53 domain-containing protein n=1 Tax=Bacterioplanes sanyensis TaxID=1249553 RepID=A0A222FEU8_9GAMM|nr:S8 family serine peptidase [Bacterioplanes sanyensis]ASP37538.1 hypothetical protein CHH28_02100 [Bacterioplanes sanyensis]
MTIKSFLVSASALVAALLPTFAMADTNKLDPALQREWARQQTPATMSAPVRVARSHAKSVNLPALVQLSNDADVPEVLKSLQAMGVQLRSRTGVILSVMVPRAQLGQVAAMDSVLRLEASRAIPKRVKDGVAASGANSLRTGDAPQWQGLTGKGVIVGVVDDGFDFLHPGFRHTDGSTRILALWDQRADAPGSAPSGFSYGGVCTAEMINAAIAQAQANETVTACTQPSSGGHGTHVASIAAGNGADTSAEAAYEYVGMAPEADLILVNGLNETIEVDFGTDTIIDGVAFIRDQAKALNKKAVVNLSLGSYYGPRDGTSLFEQALDSFVVNDGVLVVGSVGNEGDAPIALADTLAASDSRTIGFDVPDGLPQGRIDIWYDGSGRYALTLQGPNSCDTIPELQAPAVGSARVEWWQETGCGYVDMFATDVQSSNGDRQIQITLMDGDTNSLASGRWQLTLTALPGSGDSRFSMITAEQGGQIQIADQAGITQQIITDTASATHVIGVASYNTNYSWESGTGFYDIDADGYGTGPIGDISTFSSRGPRRDCSDLTKCPQVMKPEIAAPGSYIMAAKAHDYEHEFPEEITPSGQYVAFQGTSMASPHVAGALALMWQSFPDESAMQLRARLLGNTKTNTFTPQLPSFSHSVLMPSQPDYTWGYGILAVDQAVNASEPDLGSGTDNPDTGNPDTGTDNPGTDPEQPNSSSSSGGGGCSLGAAGGSMDPTLPLLVILAALALARRRTTTGELV